MLKPWTLKITPLRKVTNVGSSWRWSGSGRGPVVCFRWGVSVFLESLAFPEQQQHGQPAPEYVAAEAWAHLSADTWSFKDRLEAALRHSVS